MSATINPFNCNTYFPQDATRESDQKRATHPTPANPASAKLQHRRVSIIDSSDSEEFDWSKLALGAIGGPDVDNAPTQLPTPTSQYDWVVVEVKDPQNLNPAQQNPPYQPKVTPNPVVDHMLKQAIQMHDDQDANTSSDEWI